jgi:23S rRNA (cytosine1962-C5)-methyltransferase
MHVAHCRTQPLRHPSDAMRLVHGESDGLPGLVVDRYADTLVAQFLSAGAQRWKDVCWPTRCWRHTGLAKTV